VKPPYRCRWPTCEALDIHSVERILGPRGSMRLPLRSGVFSKTSIVVSDGRSFSAHSASPTPFRECIFNLDLTALYHSRNASLVPRHFKQIRLCINANHGPIRAS